MRGIVTRNHLLDSVANIRVLGWDRGMDTVVEGEVKVSQGEDKVSHGNVKVNQQLCGQCL